MAEGVDFSAAGFKDALGSTQGKIAIASGIAVVGWWWYRNKKSGATPTAATAAGSAGVADTSALGGVDTASGGGGYTYDGSGGNVGNGSVTPTPNGQPTNATWAQNAVAYLSGTLGQDAGTVAAALGAYLSGQPLTTAQQGIVTTALGTQGQPPTQVPVPVGFTGSNPSGGTTTSTPTPGGPKTHTVTVSKGETQKEIIRAAGIDYKTFTTLNPTLAAKGSKVHSGQKVIV